VAAIRRHGWRLHLHLRWLQKTTEVVSVKSNGRVYVEQEAERGTNPANSTNLSCNPPSAESELPLSVERDGVPPEVVSTERNWQDASHDRTSFL
jgi:hypothetical protein